MSNYVDEPIIGNVNSYSDINASYANNTNTIASEAILANVGLFVGRELYGLKYNGYDSMGNNAIDKTIYKVTFTEGEPTSVSRWNSSTETWDEEFGENSTPIESWNFGTTQVPTGTYHTEIDFWGNETSVADYETVELKKPYVLAEFPVYSTNYYDKHVCFDLYINNQAFFLSPEISVSNGHVSSFPDPEDIKRRYL